MAILGRILICYLISKQNRQNKFAYKFAETSKHMEINNTGRRCSSFPLSFSASTSAISELPTQLSASSMTEVYITILKIEEKIILCFATGTSMRWSQLVDQQYGCTWPFGFLKHNTYALFFNLVLTYNYGF